MNLPKTTLYPLSDDYLEKVDEICKKMEDSGKPIKFKGSHLGREESGNVEEIRDWLVSATDIAANPSFAFLLILETSSNTRVSPWRTLERSFCHSGLFAFVPV